MGLSRRAYAKHRGCNESAVRKAIAAGRITVEADGTIDPEKADAAWAANTSRIRSVDNGAPAKPKGKGKANGNGPVSELTRMRAKKLGADTAKVELAVDRLRGGLVDRQQVGKVVFTFFRRLRDAWMAWPDRIGREMAAELELDPDEFLRVLKRYVIDHLADLSKPGPPLQEE